MIMLQGDLFHLVASDHRMLRWLLKDMMVESPCMVCLCREFNMHTVIGIAHPSLEMHLPGQPAHVWTKSHALDHSADMDMVGLHDQAGSATVTLAFSQSYHCDNPSPVVQLSSTNSILGLIFLALAFTFSTLKET